MNIYDYRTIPPEESAYHARTSGKNISRTEESSKDGPRHMAAPDNSSSPSGKTDKNAAEPACTSKKKGGKS